MYEISELYVENYLNYCVNNKVLEKFICDLNLWTWKCIDIFLSPSCIYVWNMKVVRLELLKLSYQNQSVDKVPLWPWPLDPVMYRCLPLTILHLCMKSVRWKLLNLSCQNQSVNKVPLWPWPYDPIMYTRYLPFTILHLCMKYVMCTLKITQVIVSEPKVWQSTIVTLTFGPQNV